MVAKRPRLFGMSGLRGSDEARSCHSSSFSPSSSWAVLGPYCGISERLGVFMGRIEAILGASEADLRCSDDKGECDFLKGLGRLGVLEKFLGVL